MQRSNILCLGSLFTVITQLIHLAIINDRCKCFRDRVTLAVYGGRWNSLAALALFHLPFLLGPHLLALLNLINLIRISQ
jgi:hypothetical protein